MNPMNHTALGGMGWHFHFQKFILKRHSVCDMMPVGKSCVSVAGGRAE